MAIALDQLLVVYQLAVMAEQTLEVAAEE